MGFIRRQRVLLVFAQGEAERSAKEAGADYVGNDDLIKKVEEGWADFDIAMATPDMMGRIGKLGKVLGRKGLMPTPKAGTVVTDVTRGVAEQKMGKLEYKTDKAGVVHAVIGKKSFDAAKLKDNYTALYDAIVKAKPSTVKGVYIRSIYLAPTMGPSVKVSLN
jgi:large subunit ribosomal protein L1